MKWFEKFVAGKSVVLEDARDVGMHGLVVTNSLGPQAKERYLSFLRGHGASV
jgi:hypothetical protein